MMDRGPGPRSRAVGEAERPRACGGQPVVSRFALFPGAAYDSWVAFLIVLGVLLLIGVVAVIRHSRNFRGSAEHFASEERPDVRVSQGLPRNTDGGGFGL